MNSKLMIGAAAVAAAVGLAPAIAQVAPAPKAHGRAEVQAKVAGHFARLDSNRDGFVTKAEIASARQERREGRAERRAANRDRAFDRLDSNNDGAISREEFASARGAGRAMRMHRRMAMAGLHGRMFDMADGDRDGRVSLQEATSAALRHFDRADANRDGQVTREERRQMRRSMIEERRARNSG